MYLEILIAVVTQFVKLGLPFLAFGGIWLAGLGIHVLMIADCGNKEDKARSTKQWKNNWYKAMGVVFIGAILQVTPSIDDLWRVRVGLIKLHLASPQNITKGAEVIERIGKKLECKYIGCED